MVEAPKTKEADTAKVDAGETNAQSQAVDPQFHAACMKKRQKKKSKEEYTLVEPDKCPFVYEHKSKPCRKSFWKRPDGTKSGFCVMHAYKDSPKVKFVNCPHEPTNWMPETALEHHLTVCPKFLQISKVQAQPFFAKGINFFVQSPVDAAQEEVKDVDPESF